MDDIDVYKVASITFILALGISLGLGLFAGVVVIVAAVAVFLWWLAQWVFALVGDALVIDWRWMPAYIGVGLTPWWVIANFCRWNARRRWRNHQ